ncbi:MAG: hypothetical protein ACI8S6_003803 [Myxococcota bacterium]|jgi:hypothetical protein
MNAPTIRLSGSILHDLTMSSRAPEWAAQLREVGLLQEPPPPDAGSDWSPAEGLRDIQTALGVLRVSEAALLEAQEADPLRNLPIPDAVWGLLMVALLGVILFANALVEWLGSGAIWGGLAFAGSVALFTVVDRRRRAAEVTAQERRDAAASRLHEAVSEVVSRNFVAELGEGRLVSTPDLDKLRVLEAALALSDPGTPLLKKIQKQLSKTEGKLTALLTRTPAGWGSTGLAIDVGAYERAVDAL